ncbi:LysR family transcriptional regulator [Pseudonocardia sp. MCCB 268]|nr:LysR family transcriptional regulator [Pseudonocardia cytotoxica]
MPKVSSSPTVRVVGRVRRRRGSRRGTQIAMSNHSTRVADRCGDDGGASPSGGRESSGRWTGRMWGLCRRSSRIRGKPATGVRREHTIRKPIRCRCVSGKAPAEARCRSCPRHCDTCSRWPRRVDHRTSASRCESPASSISRQITRLEQQAGVPLFERHPGGMRRSPARRLLIEEPPAAARPEEGGPRPRSPG